MPVAAILVTTAPISDFPALLPPDTIATLALEEQIALWITEGSKFRRTPDSRFFFSSSNFISSFFSSKLKCEYLSFIFPPQEILVFTQ